MILLISGKYLFLLNMFLAEIHLQS